VLTLVEPFYYYVLSSLMGLFGIHLIIRKGILASKFLGISLSLYAFRIITSYFTTGGRLLEFPELALIQSPSHFLFGPIHFLFVYYILKPQKTFSKFFWLLFIPFGLHLAEMLPFYFGPVEAKLQEIQLIMTHKSLVNYPSHVNHLPTLLLSILKVVSTLGYSILSLGFILFFIKKYTKVTYQKNKWLLNWLLLEGSFGLLSAIFSACYVAGIIGFNNLIFSYTDLLMLMASFINLMVILLKPSLLDGTVFQSLVNRLHEEKRQGNPGENEALLAKYETLARKLEEYFLTKKPFLDSQLRQENVADQLGVSSRELSRIMQYMYQLSYPDFVNSWRINYIVEQINHDQKWRGHSQELLAEMSGFGTRQGLHNAISKLHGMTPASFFEQRTTS